MVSYAEIYYDEPMYHRAPPRHVQNKFELDPMHFILVYILALFIMTFSK